LHNAYAQPFAIEPLVLPLQIAFISTKHGCFFQLKINPTWR